MNNHSPFLAVLRVLPQTGSLLGLLAVDGQPLIHIPLQLGTQQARLNRTRVVTQQTLLNLRTRVVNLTPELLHLPPQITINHLPLELSDQHAGQVQVDDAGQGWDQVVDQVPDEVDFMAVYFAVVVDFQLLD